mmetsp:Transcript_56594/g.104755  ORF Transcript_56594/g.104755 Transcript_56594/m.104755 type:complete len:353 (+) Transcript_56594:90-1148(+)
MPAPLMGLLGAQPAQAKRPMDDELCYRFYKRLRINPQEDAQADAGMTVMQGQPAASASHPYCAVNSLLHALHNEQLARKYPPASALAAAAMACGFHNSSGASSSTSAPQDTAAASTSFSIADVVQCNHGPGGRCLQCSGRLVENVSLASYCEFCKAYGQTNSTTAPLPWATPPTGHAADIASTSFELTFAAMASLTAALGPDPGERMLHLGSGTARAVAAWVLLQPHASACGIEANPALHAAALDAASRLSPVAQSRIHLHNAAPLSAIAFWHQATVIILDLSMLDDVAFSQAVDGLQQVQEGTRIVSVSRPLCSRANTAPVGFDFARQAAYRNATGVGNTTLFIYRKLPAE